VNITWGLGFENNGLDMESNPNVISFAVVFRLLRTFSRNKSIGGTGVKVGWFGFPYIGRSRCRGGLLLRRFSVLTATA
jgi:hypothetical protein